MTEHQCAAPLWAHYKCDHPVTANRDGKWFCSSHDPVESARRVEEFQRKLAQNRKPDATDGFWKEDTMKRVSMRLSHGPLGTIQMDAEDHERGAWVHYTDAAAIEAERDALREALRDVLVTVNRNDRAIKHEAGSMVWIVKEQLDRWAKALGEGR